MATFQNIEILPNNVPSDNKIKSNAGNPLLSFNIGSQNAFLNGATLRIQGKLNVYKTGTTRPVSTENIRINSRLGVLGCFEQLNIESMKYKTDIETINNYNRMLSSYLPSVSNVQDHIGSLSQTHGTAPNWFFHTESNLTDSNNYFCTSLPSGLLSYGMIPLSEVNGVGGLTINLNLAASESFLFGTNGITTDVADAYYELEDVRLIAEITTPDPQTLQKLLSAKQNEISFNTVYGDYATINSTNAIINRSLGVSNCLGVYINFVKDSFLNTKSADGLSTYPIMNGVKPSNIREIIFLKDGVKYPNEYTLETNFKTNSNSAGADPQRVELFKNSIMSNKHTKNNTLISPITDNRTFQSRASAVNQIDQITNTGSTFGLGVAYNTLPGGDGVDFKSSNFGLQLDVDLDTDSANAIYIFAHHKQTLLMSGNQGIQVMK
jgi:hypothetical protein